MSQVVSNDFLQQAPANVTFPSNVSATGLFYDYKNYLSSKTTITSTSSVPLVSYRISIEPSDKSSSTSTYKEFDVTDSLHVVGSSSILEVAIADITNSVGVAMSTLKYDFDNLNKYKILHTITYKETGGTGKIYKNYHIQNFTYYATPVSITDFTFNDNVANSDTLVISGLTLNHGLNVSGVQSTPIDSTVPEPTTTPTTKSPVIFTFQEAERSGTDHQNTQPDELLQYSKSYESSGSYNLTDIQLTAGKVYKVTAQFSWALGYTAFSRSTQNLYILNRPNITAIDQKPLSTHDSNNIVMDITMAGLVDSGNTAAPSKVWFEFYNYVNGDNVGTLVARAGGDPAANNPVSGIVTNSNNVYPLKLNEIAIENGSGGLLNGSNYAVRAVVRYEGDSSLPNVPQFRYSNVFGPLNFDTTYPEITGIVKNNLYVADSGKKIITISVKNSAYYLYAPNVTDAARFMFYDPSVSPPSLVATTANFNFVNDHLTATAQTYNVRLNQVTIGGNLVNDKEYLIRMEVDLTKHDGTSETRKSTIDTNTHLDSVTFDSREPKINSLIAYDAQNDGSGDNMPTDNPTDSTTQPLINIFVEREAYELVAPNSSNGIRFIIYDSNSTNATIVATTSSDTFVNTSTSGSKQYDVYLDDINLEANQPNLSNGVQYYIKAAVSIVLDDGTTEERLSTDATSLMFSQDIAAIASLSVANTWDLVSGGIPSSQPSFFNNSPKVGITAYFNKTDQFGSGYTNQLDVSTTKFKVEYKVGSGAWTNVKKAVLIQQLAANETFQAAVNRATSSTLSTNSDGLYNNVVGASNVVGTSQPLMILYIPQVQEGTALAFAEHENDRVKLRVSIYDPTGMWNNPNTPKFSNVTESSNLYVINKINTYDYSGCSDTEPYNTTDNDGALQINIPVNWDSIYAHSVVVGIKYSPDPLVAYTYSVFGSFLNNNYTTFVTLPVNPASGTTLYYNVAYIVSNLNNSSTDTDQGLTIAKNVPNKAFPTSSDYAVSSTSYKTFNTGSESSISFTLTFQPNTNRRIDGVNVYFTSPGTSDGSNISKIRIGTYLATNGGAKTIQLLYTNSPSTINNDTTTNNTNLNILDSAGQVVVSGSVWGDFDMANISFEAHRDRRVSCSSASYDDSTNYKESGSSDFGSVIYNVPKLSPPSINGDITLESGIINSSTPTILKWVTANNTNNTPYKYNVSLTSAMTSTTQTTTLQTIGSLTLNLHQTTTDTYTILLYKVFDVSTTGSNDEISPADTITFCSIKVETTNVGIQVVNPSDTSKVNVTFNDSVVTGNSVIATGNGQVAASFSENVTSQYLAYTKTLNRDPFTASELLRVADVTALTAAAAAAAAADAAANKESVPSGSKKEYTIPSVINPGDEMNLYIDTKAKILYRVNTASRHTIPVSVPKSPDTSTHKYLVSTLPNISLAHSGVVSIPGSSNPHLLLNLNANGLEYEGMISLFVLLTQDGDTMKPEGEHAMYLFPSSGASFGYLNPVTTTGGEGADIRLGAGDTHEASPVSISHHSTSTLSASATLTMGALDSNGRFGVSRLRLPSSSDSGFKTGFPVNYFFMATHRRGTDTQTGSFTYNAPVAVTDIPTITASGSDYFLNFTLGTL